MGWYTDAKKRVVRTAKKGGRLIADNAGKAVRAYAVLQTGLVATAACVPIAGPAAPACGLTAAVAADAMLGDALERGVGRAIGAGVGVAGRQWRREGNDDGPPPEMITTVAGETPQIKGVSGQYEAPERVSLVKRPGPARAVVITAGVVAAASALALLVLQRTGRLSRRT